ncbi:uncharacterized protein BYT42DRAFT_579429 [Radiomyces spectabilis]|uniref:uncharacterized protein n=1 Tax=Radiomyces spectabilis TaxID=64574 RepID=UPI0022204568|nr:uncharacterized protein BYT42DRAFT_579429 [Radiomyces spectabilis]KAI8373166.1 hypothetical protein BYT42DRAFT_579429 [Radiomyces spectabilis]
MDPEDTSYLAMINNPAINPASSNDDASPSNSKSSITTQSATFDEAVAARQQLDKVASDLCLVSETDASFEPFSVPWSKPSLPYTDPKDAYGQATGFSTLQNTLEMLFGADQVKVYLCGEVTVTVIIVGVVNSRDKNETALVGLKSTLVET